MKTLFCLGEADFGDSPRVCVCVSLGGSHRHPETFAEFPSLTSQKKFPVRFPGTSLSVDLKSNPEVPQKFLPDFPRSSQAELNSSAWENLDTISDDSHRVRLT